HPASSASAAIATHAPSAARCKPIARLPSCSDLINRVPSLPLAGGHDMRSRCLGPDSPLARSSAAGAHRPLRRVTACRQPGNRESPFPGSRGGGMASTVFVTGATGFLVGALIARLLERDEPLRLLFLVRADSRRDGLARLQFRL